MSVKRLMWSNLAAQSAEQISLAAAPIFAVVYLGAGVGETGFLNFAQTLPFLLFAIPAGILADRFSRVRVMVWAEALRVCALLAVLALALAGLLTWPLLALFGFVAAGATVAFSVAAPALVPGLVGPAARGAANARIELARTLAFTAEPAAGALLVGWSGAIAAFVASHSRDMPVKVAIDGGAAAHFERGRMLHARRIGQMNLACLNCHEHNAGRRLLAQTISQGHANAYPIYRLEWQALGSLQRRLRAWYSGVRADLPPYNAPDLLDLSLFLAWRGERLAVEAPGVRR